MFVSHIFDHSLRGALCRSLVQTPEARRLTAYHESGHALVAMHSEAADPIHKATIVPRGHALGMVSQVRHPFVRVRQRLRRCLSVCLFVCQIQIV